MNDNKITNEEVYQAFGALIALIIRLAALVGGIWFLIEKLTKL